MMLCWYNNFRCSKICNSATGLKLNLRVDKGADVAINTNPGEKFIFQKSTHSLAGLNPAWYDGGTQPSPLRKIVDAGVLQSCILHTLTMTSSSLCVLSFKSKYYAVRKL